MTLSALSQIVGSVGLVVAGVLGVGFAIWATYVYNRSPEDAPLRRLIPWSPGMHTWLFVGVVCSLGTIVFGIGRIAMTLNLQAVCLALFWVALAIAGLRFMWSQRDFAARLRDRFDAPDH
jgi:hypothetical protein